MGVDPSIFPVIAAHRNISTNTCDKHRPKCYATIKIIINGLPSFHDCVKPSVKEQTADITPSRQHYSCKPIDHCTRSTDPQTKSYQLINGDLAASWHGDRRCGLSSSCVASGSYRGAFHVMHVRLKQRFQQVLSRSPHQTTWWEIWTTPRNFS